MNDLSDQPPRRRLRFLSEFAVIVLSILAAFWLDAWWEGRREAAEVTAELETLHAEFSATRAEIEDLRGALESLRTSVVALLPHIAPDAALLPIDSLNVMIDFSFRLATFELRLGSVEALLASGELSRIPNAELKSLIAAWPADVARLRRQSGLLEENRELLLDHMHAMIPTLDIARNTGQMERYPASSFSASSALVQRDLRLEGLFGNRGMMIEDTDDILIELGERTDRILALLAKALGPD